MLSFLFSVAAGLACGILSGFGIGGGTLLMVWMSAALSMEQRTAQGVNLIFFLPTALAALFLHVKNRALCWRAIIPAALAGCATAAAGALLAANIDASLLRRLFGGFLIIVGLCEIFGKKKQDQSAER